MSRYLERKRGFWVKFGRSGTWGFSPWDTNYYPRKAMDRNEHPAKRTTIPRFLQSRLINAPRAVANGWVWPTKWSSRWKRIRRLRKNWINTIVRHYG